jgi:hypothetical protein
MVFTCMNQNLFTIFLDYPTGTVGFAKAKGLVGIKQLKAKQRSVILTKLSAKNPHLLSCIYNGDFEKNIRILSPL